MRIAAGRRRGRVWAAATLGALLVTSTSAWAGEPPWPDRTQRVSLAHDGGQGEGSSQKADISLDGRFVAFESRAENLVPDDTNTWQDIFVVEVATGAIERVSVASDGTQGDWASFTPSISGDGRFVAFAASSTNLVPDDTNGEVDIFVHDRGTGTTERVSVASDGTQANNQSQDPSISADGRYVVFESWADNLVVGDTNAGDDDPFSGSDIFWHDRETGETRRVSVSSEGAQADSWSAGAAISAGGKHVAFVSHASNLVPGSHNGAAHVYVHEVDTGVTERISVSNDGTQANSDASPVSPPSLSADGRYVTFDTPASNLIPFDTNFNADVFVRDRVRQTTERISVTSVGAQAPPPHGSSFRSRISPDGRFVVFDSGARLVPPTRERQDGPLILDIYLHDRLTGITEMVSVDEDGIQPDNSSFYPSATAGGRHVAFEGRGTTLVPGDTNGFSDIFTRDAGPPIGVGHLSATVEPGGTRAAGWARFLGAVLAEESSSGTSPLHARAGLDISGARAVYRPGAGDVLVRVDLTNLPSVSGLAGTPGVVYGVDFEIEGVRYQARAVKPVEEILSGRPHLDLYRCAPGCERIGDLDGSYGESGADVRFSLPLDALEASEGKELESLRAFTGFGTREQGVVVPADALELGDAVIPTSVVELGIVRDGDPPSFDVQLKTPGEIFEAFVEDRGLRSYDVVARGCLGGECGPVVRVEGRRGPQATAMSLEVEGRGVQRVFEARLWEADDPATGIPGRTIEFFADGTAIGTATTDEEGVATIQAPPRYRGGRHTFEAVFAGDDLYLSSSARKET
jgi:Tol biopolymer transport system component